MNGYTHMVVGGLTSGLVVAASVGAKKFGLDIQGQTLYPALMVIPSIIGGLGPDIDMPNSTSGRFVRKVLFLAISGVGIGLLALSAATAISGGVWESLIPLVLFFVIGCGLLAFVTLSKHRRETHCGLLCLILFLPLFWIIYGLNVNLLTNVLFSVWAGFWLGWFSHLVADSFNRKGVPWLFPLKNSKGKYKYYHIMTITTGTEEETIFRIITIVLSVVVYIALIFLGGVFA